MLFGLEVTSLNVSREDREEESDKSLAVPAMSRFVSSLIIAYVLSPECIGSLGAIESPPSACAVVAVLSTIQLLSHF